MENYTVMSTEQRFSDRAEKDVEVTLTLPDYLPNCVKIIRCDAKPVITEKNLRDGNLTVCGKLNMRLLYISDYNDKPKCFSDSRDFSHDFIPKTDLSDENTVIGTEVSLISCPCKMLSARQLQCTPRISLNVFANCAETHKLYDPSDGKNDGVCAKTEQTAVCEKSYIEPVSDTLQTQINLENGEPNISEILCTDAEPVITSATCRDGAADYSGYTDIHCIYEAEQSDEEQTEPAYFAVKRRVEFSGSVDMPGITPDSKAVLVPEVFMTDSGISYDPYGENRIITLNVQYIVSGSLYNCGITEICTDAFGTKYKCDAKYGVRSYDNTLQLTLIRAGYDPDPDPEKGLHEFSLSLGVTEDVKPESLSLFTRLLNRPAASITARPHKGTLAGSGRFLTIRAEHARLAAVKRAEDGNGIIVRLINYGEATQAALAPAVPPRAAHLSDIRERTLDALTIQNGAVLVPLRAHGLTTVRIED